MNKKPGKAKESARKKKTRSSTKPKPKVRRKKSSRPRSPGIPREQGVFKPIGKNIRCIRLEKVEDEKMADFGFAWRHYQRIEMGKRNLTL